ncbi:AraC family transcriptional regulator [Isoptericola sp. NPDC057653]|uniref:AraC family transcriptional regulator n=1 Tax=Isoptericola sp. NPDC057653 TaxID=3346195 RepID=UPI0036BB3B41
MTPSRPGGGPTSSVRAWRPRVPGVAEVLHARFAQHAYPMHVHDAWTLLVVDDGAVRYELGRREHGTPRDTVTLLPPQVPHNGAPASREGFRKRVVYLDGTWLAPGLVGAAVDAPDLVDAPLRRRVGLLHDALARPGDELEAESRLALVAERLHARLRPGGAGESAAAPPPRGLAADLRDLLDERLVEGVALGDAGALLGAHPTHLVRAFSRRFGIPPHQYLVTRRVDRARRLLLDGRPPAEAAAAAGFADQAHLTRHFRRVLGTTPARFAASGRPAAGPSVPRRPVRRPAGT